MIFLVSKGGFGLCGDPGGPLGDVREGEGMLKIWQPPPSFQAVAALRSHPSDGQGVLWVGIAVSSGGSFGGSGGTWGTYGCWGRGRRVAELLTGDPSFQVFG